MRRLGYVLALTLVGGGVGYAQQHQDQPRDQSQRMEKTNTRAGVTDNSKDKDFVEKAAQGGMAEVKLSKLAMDRAQSMDVKHFARKMVEDHSKANTELKQIAEKKDLTVPTKLDDKHQDAYDKLAKMRGADFDKEYMKVMNDDHDDTIKLLKNEMENGQDPELKSFASKTLPVVQKHDSMLQSDMKKVDNEQSQHKEMNK